jgi:hypothetical protein
MRKIVAFYDPKQRTIVIRSYMAGRKDRYDVLDLKGLNAKYIGRELPIGHAKKIASGK